MMHFALRQKWISSDGKLHGEVVDISDDGNNGVLVITDDKGTTVGDRNDKLSDLATELQRRYAGYMQQKEYLAYLGYVVYLGAASTILLSEDGKWPPPITNWGSNNTELAIAAIIGLWVFAFCYLRFELRRRRWAAMRLAGCEHVLVRLVTAAAHSPDDWKAEAAPPRKISRLRRAVGWVFPLNKTVRVITPPPNISWRRRIVTRLLPKNPPSIPPNVSWWRRPRIAVTQCIIRWWRRIVTRLLPKDPPSTPDYPKIFVEEWVNQEERGTDAILHERLIIPTGWIVFVMLFVNTCSRPQAAQFLAAAAQFLAAVKTSWANLLDGIGALGRVVRDVSALALSLPYSPEFLGGGFL